MQKHPDKTWLRTIQALVLSCFLALAAGCGDGGGGSTSSAVTRSTTLTGAQEIPVTGSLATGTATVTIDAARTTITVSMTTTGLTGVTASHIHVGGPTVANGGIIFSLFDPTVDGAFTGTVNKNLTSANLSAKPLEGVTTFADAVNAILNGNAYINVHTSANPGGEIRGNL